MSYSRFTLNGLLPGFTAVVGPVCFSCCWSVQGARGFDLGVGGLWLSVGGGSFISVYWV